MPTKNIHVKISNPDVIMIVHRALLGRSSGSIREIFFFLWVLLRFLRLFLRGAEGFLSISTMVLPSFDVTLEIKVKNCWNYKKYIQGKTG